MLWSHGDEVPKFLARVVGNVPDEVENVYVRV